MLYELESKIKYSTVLEYKLLLLHLYEYTYVLTAGAQL